MSQPFELIGVLGGGQMGSGIAQVSAAAGLSVVVVDKNDNNLARARTYIERSLGRLVTKKSLTPEEHDATLARISFSRLVADFAPCDIIVEAVTENRTLKHHVFRELDSVAKPGAVLASNTSSLSITELGGVTRRSDRVVGMHFMNPVPMMQLVEIIRGIGTSDETFDAVVAFAQRVGKTTVAAQDYPGFIVNRILIPMINEAAFALMENVGTVDDIDTAMKLGANHPLGPLALGDLIGLDVCVAIMDTLHNAMGDPKYRACPLLRRYVAAGWLGRKSGRGFYVYPR
jgi:3-hydroxybutyryl-CoA dehydrogenase